MSGWAFVALGTPAPQGSKKGFVNPRTGGVIIVEQSKKVKPWREAVKAAAPRGAKLDGPIAVRMVFTLARPKSARKIDVTPFKTPDLSKLVRSTEDGITDSGLWADDARVADYRRLAKVWTGFDPSALQTPGVIVAAVEMEGGDWRTEPSALFQAALDEHRAEYGISGSVPALPPNTLLPIEANE